MSPELQRSLAQQREISPSCDRAITVMHGQQRERKKPLLLRFLQHADHRGFVILAIMLPNELLEVVFGNKEAPPPLARGKGSVCFEKPLAQMLDDGRYFVPHEDLWYVVERAKLSRLKKQKRILSSPLTAK